MSTSVIPPENASQNLQTPNAEEVLNTSFRDLDPEGVIEQPFWERYNSRLEMPTGTAMAVLVYVAAVMVMVMLPYWASDKKDRTPIPISALGNDEEGDGSEGNGGTPDLALGQLPQDSKMTPEKQQALNDVKDEIRERIQVDGTDGEIPDSAAAALATLDKNIRDKILGAKAGSGNGTSGGESGNGSGPGGTGASSTYARAMRWVIKFDTRSGNDYVAQIGGLKGVIMVPTADGKKMYLFRNPTVPDPKVVATDADHANLSSQIRFDDNRPKSIEAVSDALKLGYLPPVFLVYFPRDLEEKLSKLETNYRGIAAENIKQTTFRVILRGGAYDLVVTDQVRR